MTNVKKFNALLNEGHKQEALAFCERMIKEQSHLSFYHFWLKKLNSTEVVLQLNKTSKINNSHETQEVIDLSKVKEKLKQAFCSHSYTVSPSSVPHDESAQKTEKARLVKSFPFTGDIYLPTSKIPLSEQVSGLQAVSCLVKKDNIHISKTRFENLKSIIQQTGKKRVFVLGNGPSLKKTDLDLLKDEVTIGFNGIFLHETFKPTIYVVEDHLVAEDRVKEIEQYECPVKIFPSYLGYCLPVQENTIFLNHLSRKSFPVDTDFSDDVGDISYTGGTVTYTGLQIAASLGFEEIYLVGVDASYKVENVERSTDYGTGVLESKSDDVNHFDPTYFGKGYRWHDPNVHTMLQAYRKVRNYADIKGITVANATIGGELDVFPRVDFHALFEHKTVYPKVSVIDFTHIDWLCATGIVKKNMFDGWAKHSLFHVHGQHPDVVSAYQKVKNDVYAEGADRTGIWAALRTLMEFSPDVLYLRPTHDRPALSIIQMMMPIVIKKPFVIHYMDDWLAKVKLNQGREYFEVYYQAMKLVFTKANRVLTISQKMADYLEVEFGVPKANLQVVHNYIQEPKAFALPKDPTCKVIRYFGGMEPDMSLASIKQVAEAVEKMSTPDQPVRFEIYTGQNYIERFGERFKAYKHTQIQNQHENYQVYLALLESSDLNVLCYNYDEKSEAYLKYSMANKLPEIIGSDVPFLAIGSKEIGTITYLLEEQYPFVVSQDDQANVNQLIEHILFDQSSASEQYFDSISRLKGEFSSARNQSGFQNMLRKVSAEPVASYSQHERKQIIQLSSEMFGMLGDRKSKYASLKVLNKLLMLSDKQLTDLNLKMKSHGVSWQFKQTQPHVEKILRKQTISHADEVDLLAFLITSLEHERFDSLNSKIKV